MINENYGKCETTKTDSNFPPSLQSSWENEFVVKIKRKRKKQSSISSTEASPPSSSTSYSSSSGRMMRNINSFKDENNIHDEGVRKSFFCGHQPNATTMSKLYKNIFPLFLIIVVIFNTQITFQRPLHNSNVEEGSLTSAMVRILNFYLFPITFH